MPLTPRQARLASELISDPAYVSGERRFKTPITRDDAVDLAGSMHEQMDAAAEARATAATDLGKPLACGPGCSGCCEELVMIFRPEALRIARWLKQRDNAAAKQRFLETYPTWKQRVGDTPTQIADLFGNGDEAAHEAALEAHWRRRIMCAFNQDGMCTIYPVRPLLCRNAHALETSANCYGDSPAQLVRLRLKSDELDAFVGNARSCLRAAHHAIGGPRMRPAALCDAVFELLS